MNYKKAVGAGLLVFAIQFAMVNVLSNLIGPFLGGDKFTIYAWQGAMIVLLVAIVYCVSKWYFTGSKATLQNGVILGVVLVVTNVVITLSQAIPSIIQGGNANGEVTNAVVTYLTGVPFLLTAVITIAAAAGTAHLRHRSAACNVKDAIGSCMPKAEDEDCDDCKDGTCSIH